jgi:hypothetical protein
MPKVKITLKIELIMVEANIHPYQYIAGPDSSLKGRHPKNISPVAGK